LIGFDPRARLDWSIGMAGFKRILVPIDFSDVSRSALRCATEMAGLFDASITLLHVVEDLVAGALTAGVTSSASHSQQACAARAARERLEQWRDDAPVGSLRVDCAVKAGSPISEILGHAERHGVDLIVMGTHGRRAIARAWLGSVTECVVRMSPCPVLTVRVCHHQVSDRSSARPSEAQQVGS
jgi:nucleotide-binding universal stress UspA family protein